MGNVKKAESNPLYTLIPLDDFLHGVLHSKTLAKALITAASMPPKGGGNLLRLTALYILLSH
jgi:hypothetical protein